MIAKLAIFTEHLKIELINNNIIFTVLQLVQKSVLKINLL